MALNLLYALVALIALRHILLDARGDELKVYQQPIDHVAIYDICCRCAYYCTARQTNPALYSQLCLQRLICVFKLKSTGVSMKITCTCTCIHRSCAISISNTRVRVGVRSNRHFHAHHESTCLDSLEVCEDVLIYTEKHRRLRKWQI